MASPSHKSLLIDSFEFDLFANKLWLPVILGSGNEAERSIFGHILSASKVWTVRLGGVSPKELPAVSLTEQSLQATHSEWLSAIERFEYNDRIEYVNLRGVQTSAVFGDIARHTVNHGTYHRGQLRQLLEARGADFPETDFMIYVASRTL